MHAHIFALVEPKVEQDIEIADGQAAMPAEVGSQATGYPIVSEAERLPGTSAFRVLGFRFLVLGWSTPRLRDSAPLLLACSPARLLAFHHRHSTGQ
jgi:hypothetical protein